MILYERGPSSSSSEYSGVLCLFFDIGALLAGSRRSLLDAGRFVVAFDLECCDDFTESFGAGGFGFGGP
jgi:hypothetical protein